MSKGKKSSFVDYYELLGVKTTVSDQALRKAFLLRAKDAHPDAGGSTEAMQQLNKAYKTLASHSSRAAYDRMHGIHTGSSTETEFHYTDAPGTKTDDMDDEYIDMFLDQVYQEFSHEKAAKKRKKPKDILSDLFGN